MFLCKASQVMSWWPGSPGSKEQPLLASRAPTSSLGSFRERPSQILPSKHPTEAKLLRSSLTTQTSPTHAPHWIHRVKGG